jgi:endonuclease/exonuclease/phosphatase family metal-dependent hydrolase
MTHRRLIFVAAVTVVSLSSAQMMRAESKPSRHRDITVMTRNLYVGADLTLVTLQPTPPNVEAMVGMVEQTDFPARAEALADEIEATPPLLIGLQEVSLFRSQTPGDFLLGQFTPNAEEIEFDYLEILLAALDSRGLAYAPVAVLPGFDGELPGIGRDIRLTDHEVILVRTDLSIGEFQVVDVAQGYFVHRVELTFPFVGKVPIARGWVAVDARVRGKPFRFLSTHLEPAEIDPRVQFLQAGELVAGPADTDLPLIFVGDFNSSAEPHPVHGTPTYTLLLDAGFIDAWNVARPGEPGYTSGQAVLLDNEDSLADARIDFVFVRDAGGPGRGRARRPDIDLLDADIVGDVPGEITESVRWASDHFGVVARLRLLP